MGLCNKINHILGTESESDRMSKNTLNNKNRTPDLNGMSIVDGLRLLYTTRVLPLEKYYLFDEFHSPPLEPADFVAKPTVLMVGQYSTGKTTFIKYLLEKDYPGIRIGPEPTTDRFISIMFNKNEGTIPGNALVIDSKKQFRPLVKFGNAFLNRLQISECNSPVLEGVTFVDTPGILSGEKQRTDRGYDFPGVLEWFAERVDRIILMFDANKLDISDEMKNAIIALSGYDHKIRIVLNKADSVPEIQLLRVYGALMWSLAKVMKSPESVRVYIGSFWDKPLNYEQNRQLFEDEERELLLDLKTLPRDGRLRKLNDLIKRARLVRVHGLIVCSLRDRMPIVFNRKHKQNLLVKQLPEVYLYIQNTFGIQSSDFPDLKKMQTKLQTFDFRRFSAYNKPLFEQLNRMLNELVPKLMASIAEEQMSLPPELSQLNGGKFDGLNGPFNHKKGVGFDAGSQDPDWIVDKQKEDFEKVFQSLCPTNGKISSSRARVELFKSKLPNSVLNKIYKLSDVDTDGYLDADEFALAMYLMQVKLSGHDLPIVLPAHLIPPSKRIKTTQ